MEASSRTVQHKNQRRPCCCSAQFFFLYQFPSQTRSHTSVTWISNAYTIAIFDKLSGKCFEIRFWSFLVAFCAYHRLVRALSPLEFFIQCEIIKYYNKWLLEKFLGMWRTSIWLFLRSIFSLISDILQRFIPFLIVFFIRSHQNAQYKTIINIELP